VSRNSQSRWTVTGGLLRVIKESRRYSLISSRVVMRSIGATAVLAGEVSDERSGERVLNRATMDSLRSDQSKSCFP